MEDAVSCELLSLIHFPGCREFSREFLDGFGAAAGLCVFLPFVAPRELANQGVSREFPPRRHFAFEALWRPPTSKCGRQLVNYQVKARPFCAKIVSCSEPVTDLISRIAARGACRMERHGLYRANILGRICRSSSCDPRRTCVLMTGSWEQSRGPGNLHDLPVISPLSDEGNGGMGAPYRPTHEFIVVFCKVPKLAVNNVRLGKHDRDRTNVWSYPGGKPARLISSQSPGPPSDSEEHQHHRGGDQGRHKARSAGARPFPWLGHDCAGGRGRRPVPCGIELDPAYVEVAIARWEEMTDEKAVHVESGLSFEELRHARESVKHKNAAWYCHHCSGGGYNVQEVL